MCCYFVKLSYYKLEVISLCNFCFLVPHRDARNMARDVLNAVTSILKSQGNMDDSKAASFIKKLQSENRFMQDVWS